MKLAISNIAWPVEANEAVARMLVLHGVTGLEVAPRKLLPKPLEASESQIDDCRMWWEERGLRIVAAQGLLFGCPDLTLFDSDEIRRQTRDHLAGIIRVCGRLGAGALVFGSPRNRAIGTRPRAEADTIAAEFFRELGEVAVNAGTHLVLEAIPPANGADYITNSTEAAALVQAVAHPGFRLHLDTATMAIANEDAETTIANAMPTLRHFHISEPGLVGIGTTGMDHAAFARELRRHGYEHAVSIEMREPTPFSLAGLAESVRFVREVYG